MTDKQIIIDKLKNDVACKENIINHLAEYSIKLEKQLKAKEQECERLKNCSDEWMSKCEQETKLREFINEQLEQEKTLKEMYSTYYKAKHSDIKGEFFKLKAENEKLREENFTFEQLIKEYEKYGTIEEIIEQLNKVKAENEKLKQTFTEIKEIAEKVYNDCDNCYRDTDTNCEVDCIDCTLGGKAKLAEQILQKISEAEL